MDPVAKRTAVAAAIGAVVGGGYGWWSATRRR